MLRLTLNAAVVLLVCACSPTAEIEDPDDYAIVSTVIEEGCDTPGIRFDEISNTETDEKVALNSRHGPFYLRPGHYAISVACQNPHDESGNECRFWGHPNEYPTYKMPLSKGVKYSFRCFVDGQDISYRVSESAP